eukprot:2985344-Prymnesium_polylepis.1
MGAQTAISRHEAERAPGAARPSCLRLSQEELSGGARIVRVPCWSRVQTSHAPTDATTGHAGWH